MEAAARGWPPPGGHSPGRLGGPAGAAVAATVVILVVVAVIARYGPRHGMLVAGPVGAGVLLLVARRYGLRAGDVGLARRSWRRGAACALACVIGVAAGYALILAVPALRVAFADERYRTGVVPAMVTTFVVVPLATVLFEEVAFRGVLWGALAARKGPAIATAMSSLLFGCWHVVPSLRLTAVNPAVADLVGSDRTGQVLAVAGAVLFTGAAGIVLCELRRRSRSLLAPLGLHWAVNGFGVLLTATLAR